jgi:hypothetical protein
MNSSFRDGKEIVRLKGMKFPYNKTMSLSLTPEQATVFNTVKRHRVISALELTYCVKFSLGKIQESLDWLLFKRLIVLSAGSYPKRYKPREDKKRKNEEDF